MNAPPPWQPSVLDPIPAVARYLVFDPRIGLDPRPALARVRDTFSPAGSVIGLGQPLVLALAAEIAGLRSFPPLCGPAVAFPSTQGGLWAFIGGSDPGDVHDRARSLRAALGEGFLVREEVSAFKYRDGRDLTGFEDGTENPKEDLAVAAAIVSGRGTGLDGSSFVATQRYVHDLDGVARLPHASRDEVIGRGLETNEELANAPPSAHVKRTAQESFDPPAFLVRRSMPWGGAFDHGLYFVAYGESLGRFERVLARMTGSVDGIVDRLLSFTRAVTGGYYWCPPMRSGKIDLRAVGV